MWNTRYGVALLVSALFTATGAWAQGAAYVPDAKFLMDDPYAKTKQVVRLSGVTSEAQRLVVKSAIDPVVRFVRLFGITGTDLGDAVPKGASQEQVADIKAGRVSRRVFAEMSTPTGRSAMPIEPASGHLLHHMGEWSVKSEQELSVLVDMRQVFYELKPVKNPTPVILRLRFVRQQGQWLFDGLEPDAARR